MFKHVPAPPTNGQRFSDRLDIALHDAGMCNADLAHALGAHGHQLVHNWRRRGRVGTGSQAAFRAALPGVSLEWLAAGVGPMKQRPPLDAEAVADAYLAVVRRFSAAGMHYDVAMDPDLLVLGIEFVQEPTPARQQAFARATHARVMRRDRRAGTAHLAGARLCDVSH